MTAELSAGLMDGVLARMLRADYRAFEAQLRSSGYCARPVRLRGQVEVRGKDGRRRQVWSTDSEPDGVLRKACGNRREAICGPCAERYRGDAWQLIAAGLRGGKGIPDTVTGHPAVFASLTAPSFGPVHAHVLGPDGHPLRCRPRRDAPACEHGMSLGCSAAHAADDPRVGEPLCEECYDYAGAVVWNNLLGELWRRTTVYLPRHLAREVGVTQKRLHAQIRASYVKVAEYQRRGLVHLHVLIRLDRRMPAYRADEVRAPGPRFTSQLLEDALRSAAAAVSVPAPDGAGGHPVCWGEQVDVRQLGADVQERKRRASYLAKYSTKSTEQAGGVLERVNRGDVDRVPVRPHVRRYLRAAFRLAEHHELRDRRIGKCAHNFGYRGHCLTKSRRWSTTFKVLRQARADHVREQILARSGDRAQRELVQLDAPIKDFAFAGVGHFTTADAHLAALAAARAREQRELAREALYDDYDRGGRDQCATPR